MCVLNEDSLVMFAHLHLCIAPARNFNNHVQDGLLLVGIERNIVEWRNGDAILLDVDTVLESVCSADSASSVCSRSFGVVALF